MKTKLTILKLAVVLLIFGACTSDDAATIPDETQVETQASATITQTIELLRENLNDDGTISQNVLSSCFEFVYPLNISFNDNTIVAITNFDDLVAIALNSSSSLYIDGIEFPFQVETFDFATNSVVVIDITTEVEFSNLIDDCGFTDSNDQSGDDGTQSSDDGTQSGDDGTQSGDDGTQSGDDGTQTGDDGTQSGDDGTQTGDDGTQSGGQNQQSRVTDCVTFNYPVYINQIQINNDNDLNAALNDPNVTYDSILYPFDIITDTGAITIYNTAELQALIDNCDN
ncbi:hypothetical protein [uncultured Kordia sp.]|uniref:hypothetical protein n=1 Tax=uncultured Kordia sp. TaxID=507699 RepID=UPI002638A6FE|nr:hypothetical protein [uncultured Kordia sp.]